MIINRAKRRWTLHPDFRVSPLRARQFPGQARHRVPLAVNWPIGSWAVMRDCYGQAPTGGIVIEHFKYSVTIKTRSGQRIHGGTTLLDKPERFTDGEES